VRIRRCKDLFFGNPKEEEEGRRLGVLVLGLTAF
jgi:hypothetical protein